MMRVEVTLSDEGVIVGVEASGHAGYSKKGTDVVCASATSLLRTFVALTESLPQWEGESSAVGEGCLVFKNHSLPLGSAGVYTGICWFLLRGMEDLVREFPGHVEWIIHKTTGRLFHGS